MILTTEELKLVTNVIVRTWNAIAPDIEYLRMKNVECVEACIDADRLTSFTYTKRDKVDAEQAQTLVRKMIADAGYMPTLRYLARHVNLN